MLAQLSDIAPSSTNERLDLEQSLLSVMLMDKSKAEQIAGMLEERHFNSISNKLVFTEIATRIKEKRYLGLLELASSLKATTPDLFVYVVELWTLQDHGCAEFLVESVAYLKRLAANDQLVSLGESMLEYQDALGTEDTVKLVQSCLEEVVSDCRVVTQSEFRDDVDSAYALVLRKQQNDVVGLSTGFTALDRLSSGLPEGGLVIIAARPSVGKSAFAGALALNVAKQNKGPVVFFSLEMSKDQIISRMILSECSATGDAATARDRIAQLPLVVVDNSSDGLGLNLSSLKAEITSIADKHGKPPLVLVDYLQLLDSGKKSEKHINRVEVVSEISRGLKTFASSTKTTVIALSQLSRAVESRQDKRPILSDLRESGSIEQDADQVWFIYRDDYHNSQSSRNGIAEIIIAKNRDGGLGVVDLIFDPARSKFTSSLFN